MKLKDWIRDNKFMAVVHFIAAGILISGAVLVYWHWEWLVTGTLGREAGSTTVRNLGLIAGGLIAIWVAIWRGVVADRQARASWDQTETSRRSLLNERYQKGAEMLGSTVLYVRLGGIYALDSLAREYPEIYHLQVIKLFAAFVVARTRAETAEQVETTTSSATSESEEPDKPAPTSFWEGSDDTGKDHWLESKSCLAESFDLFLAADREVGPVPGLAKDVEEVMRLISERDEKRIALESKDEIRMNLADASLPGLIFHDADFSNIDFTKADLRRVRGWGARLTKAVLPGANLSAASLHGADFRDADMRRVNLTAARLQGADLRNANLGHIDLASQNLWKGATFHSKLVGARLDGADLRGADLGYADMRGVSLRGAKLDKARLNNLSGVNLRSASLRDTDLGGADLSKANLSGADLSGANLAGANLAGANFGNAKLAGANLTEANVSGADFSHHWVLECKSPASGLTQKQLDQAKADPNQPPILDGVLDAVTNKPLVWNGQPS